MPTTAAAPDSEATTRKRKCDYKIITVKVDIMFYQKSNNYNGFKLNSICHNPTAIEVDVCVAIVKFYTCRPTKIGGLLELHCGSHKFTS